MTLKIFLDDKSFHCLKQSIPARSRSKSIIEKVVHLELFGGNAVLSSDEAEARNLLIYAGHCPGVIASIHKAFRSARLAPYNTKYFRRRFNVSAETSASLAPVKAPFPDALAFA
jgi:hypothetical protein